MAAHDLPTAATDVPVLPQRKATTHKGESGHVALIAGSRGMSGAAVLAALGALRGGAGLVRVYCPVGVQPLVAGAEPSLLTAGLPESAAGQLAGTVVAEVPAIATWAHGVAVGPGLGANSAEAPVAELVRAVLQQTTKPVVLDADALNAAPDELARWLAKRPEQCPAIITPHPGEMRRLQRGAGLPELHADDDETRLASAHAYAQRARCVVVLKGHRTVVCTPHQAYINTTGNPGMATGGMGDVLTGLIAALLGQGLSAFEAACLGVHVHGAAADACAKTIGAVGYLAREVAAQVPAALLEAGRPRIGFR